MADELPAVPRNGTQVTLRVATPVGPISVVGEIVEADPEHWSVRRRDGSVAKVAVASIEARREMPPGRSATATPTEVQQLAAFGWRALETVRLGDWLLRASGGFTRRSNSAMAVGDAGVPLERALDLVTDWYAERGLPPTVSQADGASPPQLPAYLSDRGWQLGAVSHVMTGEVAHALQGMPNAVAGAVAGGLELVAADAPDEAWYACYSQGAHAPGEVGRRVIENHPAASYLSLRDGERAVAVARASVDARWAGLFAVAVAPDRRREGLGAAVTLGALKDAARRGARHVYLQVEVGNAAAIELYRRLNLRVHHDYRYWSSPK
ncbi:MAG TPA: GNAT family N-acetyltransferase [Mycobacteriales bacterium]|nr:GNAT family N-acetyltransferase [Mycobacteriales bacterium]